MVAHSMLDIIVWYNTYDMCVGGRCTIPLELHCLQCCSVSTFWSCLLVQENNKTETHPPSLVQIYPPLLLCTTSYMLTYVWAAHMATIGSRRRGHDRKMAPWGLIVLFNWYNTQLCLLTNAPKGMASCLMALDRDGLLKWNLVGKASVCKGERVSVVKCHSENMVVSRLIRNSQC